jgi:hypothetical protein
VYVFVKAKALAESENNLSTTLGNRSASSSMNDILIPDDELPPGWVMKLHGNKIRYYNTLSGSSQTGRPKYAAEMDDTITPIVGKDSNDEILGTIEAIIAVGGAINELKLGDSEESSGKITPLLSAMQKTETVKKKPRKSIIVSSLNDVDVTQNSLQGNLLIKSGLFNLMSKKYFILRNNVLEYYESRDAFLNNWGSSSISKSLILNDKTTIGFKDSKYTFEIKQDNNKWCLQAQNKNEMDEWISHISAAIKYMKSNPDNIIGKYTVYTIDAFNIILLI